MTLKDAHIHIQPDNRTLVAYLKNEAGGTRSLALLGLTTRVLKLAELLRLTLTATYLPGSQKGIADRLSRGRKVPEWHLLPQATEAMFKVWGVPDVDLFASKKTAVIPRYVIGYHRLLGRVLRSFQPQMELPTRVGISPTQFNTKSTNSSKQCNRDVHLNSTSGDQMFLVTRPASESHNRTTSNKEPTEGPNRPDNRPLSGTIGPLISPCLENWGWADQVAHWSIEERNLLKSSWRTSTLTTYKAPISRWLSWCDTNKINPKATEAQQVARFLAKLFLKDKLAYKTILLHKLAISTYCASSKVDISKQFLVHQVLKAISLAKPAVQKPPIRDTAI